MFQQQLVELQQNQLQSFQDSKLRMQEMMLKICEEQRKAGMAEREKDREFMLQLWKIFAQTGPILGSKGIHVIFQKKGKKSQKKY